MPHRTRLVISCFYNSKNPSELPVGFKWAKDLVQKFPCKYKITLLLHGENLIYGLKGHDPPLISEFFRYIIKKGVKIVICELCLKQQGYNNCQLLPFVKPIAFSVDYIAQVQIKIPRSVVVYDAQL